MHLRWLSPRNSLLLLIGFALLLRILLIPNPGFEADISFWKSWGLALKDLGLVESLRQTNNNYPPPFTYVLGTLVWIYSILADPHRFTEFWTNTNLWYLIVMKSLPILADVGIAGILIWFSSKFIRPQADQNSKLQTNSNNQHSFSIHHSAFVITPLGVLLAGLYLLNPVSLMDGAWWGQVDSVGVLVFLGACIALLSKRPFLAGLLYAVSMMTKLQNLIYGPVFFVFLWQYLGTPSLIRAIAGAATGFIGLNIELILARESSRLIGAITGNYDYFPWLSLNAYNLWWIVSGGKGMEGSDKILTLGLINAKTVGLLLFSSTYLMAVLHLLVPSWVRRHEQSTATLSLQHSLSQRFWEALIFVGGAFFLFQTQSHDRYAFPIIVFLLVWVVTTRSAIGKHTLSLHAFAVLYALFSLLYFYNLHTALVVNYPTNGLPILSGITGTTPTITASFLLIGLFIAFVIYILKKSSLVIYAIPLVVGIGAIIALNIPLFTKKPVPLTSFKPISQRQDYGQFIKNMPVNASGDSKTWNWLSSQYYFYKSGFGTHANSRVTFDIGGHFKTLTTDYGIDTEAQEGASAVFIIEGDGQILFTSDTMKKFDIPRHARIDITGIKRLTLITTDAGDGITNDHTDWLQPMLHQ